MHLVVDGYGGDYSKMADTECIYRFLLAYPDAIGMTRITPPHVYRYEGPKPQDWGISGFVLIAESHISVHTFPERRYINIDVFSCKEFEAGEALQEITSAFSLESTRSWVLDRGLEHAEPQQAHRAVTAARVQLQESL